VNLGKGRNMVLSPFLDPVPVPRVVLFLNPFMKHWGGPWERLTDISKVSDCYCSLDYKMLPLKKTEIPWLSSHIITEEK
jgi:hypothetical protein